MTTLSVVVPVFNDAPMLEACLASLMRQSRFPDEIIVVDNMSTDDPASVCRGGGVRGGVRIIREELAGIIGSTAAGFDASFGDIIVRLDADSQPPADWLERIEGILTTPGSPSAVTGPGIFYGTNRVIGWMGRNLYLGGYFWALGIVLGHPPLFGSNFGIKREAWLRVRDRVHRDMPEVHDDLDISYHLMPGMTVLYDKTLKVGVSARPFDTWRSLGRRLTWSYTTFDVNFREQSPIARRKARTAWNIAEKLRPGGR